MARKRFSFRRTWRRMQTVPGLGRNVTAVVVAIALGVTTMAIVFGNVKYVAPWEERLTISADFAQAPAIVPSQSPKVRIAGVDVGQVVDSEVTREGRARLTFSIDAGNEVYRDARAILRPKSAVNEMYVEISQGRPSEPQLRSGDVIPVGQTERPIQPDEVLSKLDERSRAGLTNLLAVSDTALANAPETLPAGLNATNRTVATFKPVLDQLEERRANLQRLVTSLSEISNAVGGNRERTTELANSLQEVLGTLTAREDQLRSVLSQLPGTTDQLRSSMTGLNELTGELNPALDNLDRASSRLPDVLRKVSGTVDSLDTTLDSAKPVVAKARPVAAELTPLIRDVDGSLDHLKPVSEKLDPATGTLVPYLNDVAAFIYNTSGVFAPSDGNGGFVRGHLTVPLPDAGVLPGTHGGHPDPTERGGR